MANELSMVPLLAARGQTVLPCAALGYYTEDALRVVGFDYINCIFFLEDGSKRTYGQISFNSFLVRPQGPACRGYSGPPGQYAYCDALGDCRIESATHTSVMVRSLTCSAAMLPSEVHPLPYDGIHLYTGVTVVMPGEKAAYLVKDVHATGGTMGLIDNVLARLAKAGVTVIGHASYEFTGDSIFHVRGEVCYGFGTADGVVHTSAAAAKAHHAAMRYLDEHPWALPVSLPAVLARLGFDQGLADTDLLCEPFHGAGCHLERAGTMPPVTAVPFSVPADVLVHGVRLGHVAPHPDGKYTMTYDSGDVGEVVTPTDLHAVFERLEVIVDYCVVLGEHHVRKMLPECPGVLIAERLGSGYDDNTGIYYSRRK